MVISTTVIDSAPPGRRPRSSSTQGHSRNSHRLTPPHRTSGNNVWGSSYRSRTADSIRIGFQNIQGLPRNPFAPKHVQLRSLIEYYKCDFFGIAELNLHFRILKSFESWKERFRRLPKNHSIHASNERFPHTRSPILFGGVGQFSFNTLCHAAMTSGSDPTGLGRWVWTRYQGRNSTTLRIITGYRPTVDSSDSTATVFSQHQRFLLANDDDRDPRKAFLEDLGICITQWQAMGDLIVLCLDANGDVRHGDISQFTRRWNLVDVHHAHHPTLLPVPTCSKSSDHPIDGIWCSRALHINAAGYAGFDDAPLYHTDHRFIWVDISLHSALQHPAPVPPYCPPSRLSLVDPRVVKRYNRIVRAEYDRHNLPAKLFALQNRVYTFDTTMAHQFEMLLKVDYSIRKLAQRKCRKLRMGRYQFSDVLKRHSQEVHLWTMLRKRRLGLRTSSKTIRRLSRATQIPNVFRFSVADIDSHRRQALQHYRKVKKDSAFHAQAFHRRLLQARAIKHGTTEITQKKILRRTAKQRSTARRIRELTSPPRPSLTTLDAPGPEGSRQICQTKNEVEAACVAEGRRRFTQAYNSPFVNEPLLSLVGLLGTGPAAENILNGTFQVPASVDIHTANFIQHLQKPECIAQHSLPNHGLSTESHCQGWRRMKSKIASSPFGPSIADYIAGCEDPVVAAVDATFATIPMITGYCPLAWRRALDVMIPKKADSTAVEKLRIIILFHALYNMFNKHVGRSMLANAERLGIIPPEVYGSRRHHRAIECVLNKVLTADLSRQCRVPLALCSNDAVSCYDRIIHSVASLCMQRLGVPKNQCHLLFGTLQQVEHYVRTTYGDSATGYAGVLLQPLQGIGQGNGAGPAIWLVISIPLINMLRDAGYGFHHISAISQSPCHFVCYTFVDDTELVQSTSDSTQLIRDLQAMLTLWEGGLRATGGALSAGKSYWYAFDFSWDGNKWKYTTATDLPGDLFITSLSGETEPLCRLEPSEARETLGVWIAPDGNQQAQFTSLVDKSNSWAGRIQSGRLTLTESWISLNSGILKSLEYSLMATSLSKQQCKAVMAPILQAILPTIHIAKTLPRVVCHGPTESLGLDIPDLWYVQGIQKIWAYMRHGDSSSITGQLLRSSVEQATLEVGLNQLLHHSYRRFGHLLTRSHLASFWHFLDDSPLTMNIRVAPLLPQCDHDVVFMQQVGSSALSRGEVRSVNLCRQWLRVLYLSDIVTGDGRSIQLEAWKGDAPQSVHANLGWPVIHRPSAAHWSVWRRYLQSLCTLQPRTLRQPLGNWNFPPLESQIWFYDALSDRVYERSDNITVYSRIPHRRLRRTRYQRTTLLVDGLPSTALRTSVVRLSPSIIMHTGSRPTMLESPNHISDDDWAIRSVSHPPDLQPILESLILGTAIAVCDGSFKDNMGTAAFCIQPSSSLNDRILGCNLTPGMPSELSAYRSELGGIYGIVKQVHNLVTKASLTSGGITLGCDCLSALTAIFASDWDSPSQSNFDLIHDIRKYIACSPLQWKWIHIRGHQDNYTPHHALDAFARLNIQMDLLAKHYWQSQHSAFEPFYADSPFAWTVWNQSTNQRCSSWNRDQLYTILTAPALQNHWRARRHIPTDVPIDWASSGLAVRSLDIYHRLSTPKWLAGFMPTGKTMTRRGLSTSDSCPRCGEPEDTSHIVRCNSSEAIARWKANLHSLVCWFRTNRTLPALARLILYHLKMWRSATPILPIYVSDPLLREAVRDQHRIGWNGFLEGFASPFWQQAQAAYFSRIGSRLSARRWIAALLRKGWNISWDMWDHRCSVRDAPQSFFFHEEHLSLNLDIELEITTGTVGWRSADLRWFRRTTQALLSESVEYKRQWLSHIQVIRARNMRRRTTAEDRQRTSFRRFFR